MRSPADEMRRVAARLRDRYLVDAGLDEAIELHGKVTSSDLEVAQATVRKRVRGVQSACDELRQLLNTLTELRAVARFTAEGWEERHAQLHAAFTADPMAGLADWIEEWCQAAADIRIDALERLTAGAFPYPPESQLLVERFTTAHRALAQRNWGLARPVLRFAADGLSIGRRQVPASEVRAAILILLARMAVALGEDPSADLEAARAVGAGIVDTAVVQAWSARLAGHHADAAARLADARSVGFSTAVLAELVIQARESSAEKSLSAAREGVAGLASTVDFSSQLDRLIEPIPPELWLALAERAASEGDTQLAETALDNAEQAMAGNFALGALICEHRVDLLANANADLSKQADALLGAGSYRLSAGQPEIAERHFQKALALRPDDVQAALSLVSAQAWTWLPKPGDESVRHQTEAIGSLESLLAKHGVDANSTWALLNAAVLHQRLMSLAADAAADHMWRAMLAIARVLAFDANQPLAWVQLADTLGTFGLYQSAAFAAKHARALEPGPPVRDEIVNSLIRAAANLGDLQAALSLFESAESGQTWIQAVEGFVKWRLGDKAEAIKLLRRAVTDDPSLLWARQLLMRAYLLTGDSELARREARQLRTYLDQRRDLDSLGALAESAMISGDIAAAERLGLELAQRESDSVDEGIGLSVVGIARLLTGRADGLDDLAASIMRARTFRALDDWQLIEQPVLTNLAKDGGVRLPDLTPLEEAIARRRAKLSAWADPVAELAEASLGSADPAIVGQVRAMLHVLFREAEPNPAGARAALDAGASAAQAVPEWPRLGQRVMQTYVAYCLAHEDLDEAAAAEEERLSGASLSGSAGRIAEIALLMSAAGRQDDAHRLIDLARERVGDVPELIRAQGDILWRCGQRADAAKAWEAARAAGGERLEARLAAWRAGSNRSAAVSLLHTALSRSYIDTAIDLRALPMESADIAAVIAVLEDAARDSDAAPGAMIAAQLLAALPTKLDLPADALEVELPTRWYAGMEDPLTEDPLLARYLPEARLRLPWTLPGVRARDDSSLEPDGYRILVLGMPAEEGNLPLNAEFVPADAVPLLSASEQARLTGRHFMKLAVLRRGESATGIDALLLEPAAEVVSRRIEAVATVFRRALDQFWR